MSLIEYLKSPELVVKCQEYFGVRYHHKRSYNRHDDKKEKQQLYDDDHQTKTNQFLNYDKLTENGKCHRRNISDESTHSNNSSEGSGDGYVSGSGSGKTTSTSECDSPEEQEDEIKFTITNKFWYYLFILGTALGDEIFYATCIPFWFWNIDGAVGRRVVFVWSSVMYVGELVLLQ